MLLKSMKLHLAVFVLALLACAPDVGAVESDYLSRMAAESEIKAIAVVSKVQRMSRNRDGSFMRVTFKRVHAVTPFTPKWFVGGCKKMESSWQQRSPGTVYFKPRRGDRVYVTITTNGGAITSYTRLTPQLEAVVRTEPHRIAYSKGRASVRPDDEAGM